MDSTRLPRSHDRYDELISKLVLTPSDGTFDIDKCTVSEVLVRWWRHCKKRYSRHGKGRLGGAVDWRPLIRQLREQHGSELAREFGPLKLRRFLDSLPEPWTRQGINQALSRTKQIFKWAASQELIPIATYQALITVGALRLGDTERIESRKLPPVADELVEQTLPHLPDKIRLRPRDVDTSGEVWLVKFDDHKTRHHGKERMVYLGPRAQAILVPWLLKAGGPDRYVFPSRGRRCYTSDSYRRAIQRICERREIESWSPNQLRKAKATEVRERLGVEHAASVFGHSSSVVTAEHYAAACKQRAMDAARKLG